MHAIIKNDIFNTQTQSRQLSEHDVFIFNDRSSSSVFQKIMSDNDAIKVSTVE
jgi:hypothetical protein